MSLAAGVLASRGEGICQKACLEVLPGASRSSQSGGQRAQRSRQGRQRRRPLARTASGEPCRCTHKARESPEQPYMDA